MIRTDKFKRDFVETSTEEKFLKALKRHRLRNVGYAITIEHKLTGDRKEVFTRAADRFDAVESILLEFPDYVVVFIAEHQKGLGRLDLCHR